MSDSIKVEVKWGNKVFKDVPIVFSEHPDVFRAHLYSLTQVPPENQKLMLRPALGDSWTALIGKIKNGQKIMMTGTAEQVVAPKTNTVFLEDLPPEEQAVALYPPGLVNLGNTCYMNASLQCLRAVPEVGTALDVFRSNNRGDDHEALTMAARSLWKELEAHRVPVEPDDFLQLFRAMNIRFADQVKPGIYAQQDADEFWQTFLQSLTRLPRLENEGRGNMVGENAIEQLFGGELQDVYKRADDETDVVVKPSSFKKLACNIDGNTKHLSESLTLTLQENGVELFSPVLSQTSVFNRTSRISRLPYYLTVQFVRFFWKKKENVKAKITRPVSFPFTFDTYDYCTPELQEKLKDYRHEKKEDMALEAVPYANNNGIYDLWAVVSHRGRSSDGGHYIAFVRQSQDEDDWLEFDDDKVTPRNSDDIKRLSGTGGVDWHIAYLCVYKSRPEFKRA